MNFYFATARNPLTSHYQSDNGTINKKAGETTPNACGGGAASDFNLAPVHIRIQ